MKIVIFGLSVTSSWGNGHATTYRALLSALKQRGHEIVFFEKNEEWYASNRDLPSPDFCDVRIFDSWRASLPIVQRELRNCDVAVLGSFFPHGTQAADELLDSRVPTKIFYDIDTPITLAKLRAGGADYLRTDQVPGFDLYLSFTAGPILTQFETEFGARRALPLFCSVEETKHFPRPVGRRYECDLSYMGTYASDRQGKLDELFTKPACELPTRKMLLAGSQYPAALHWPANVRHIRHLSPRWHPHFYSSSRLTLNLTRADMVQWGFSPSVRLFEAGACGCPVVSDDWPGLDTVFTVGKEILVARNRADVISLLSDADPSELRAIGRRAQERVLAEHTSTRRAQEFEQYVASAVSVKPSGRPAALSMATASPQVKEWQATS